MKTTATTFKGVILYLARAEQLFVHLVIDDYGGVRNGFWRWSIATTTICNQWLLILLLLILLILIGYGK